MNGVDEQSSAWRAGLKRFINSTGTEVTVGVLIVLSIAITLAEVSAMPGTAPRFYYEAAGALITGVFVVELTLRWLVARSTTHFLRQYWVDILAVLPVVRPLRMLRVLRLLRLVRLGTLLLRRSRRVRAALQDGMAENALIVIILVVVFLIGALGMRLSEPDNFHSVTKAVWWSLYTLMAGEPIGGEPTTAVGRVITMVVMLGGFTIFAMFTGVVSAVMVDRLRGGIEAKEMELEDLSGHYLVCGWNRSARRIIGELQASAQTRDTPVVIVAEMEGEPDYAVPGVNTGLIFFVRGDFTSAELLRRVRVEHAARAILLADKSKPRSDQDRDARTVLAALTIEKMNPHIHTCAELLNRDNSGVLELAKVEDIIVGDEYMGNIMAHSTRAYGIIQVLDELLTSTRGNEFYKVPPPADLVGCTLGEALPIFKARCDSLIVAIEHGNGEKGRAHTIDRHGETRTYVTNPPADYVIQATDALIIIGDHPDLEEVADD